MNAIKLDMFNEENKNTQNPMADENTSANSTANAEVKAEEHPAPTAQGEPKHETHAGELKHAPDASHPTKPKDDKNIEELMHGPQHLADLMHGLHGTESRHDEKAKHGHYEHPHPRRNEAGPHCYTGLLILNILVLMVAIGTIAYIFYYRA